ncbi:MULTISPECIES: hypothetical protein [unclassified Streptomyces]|uniref:Uncharacterized protein n=1 Tax=Streptomyces sp. NBC_00119 TaxID=2975659 RepID=A0AAU1TZB4_9ACTN|nr:MULTISPECIES: hypothetical protein [unclassified Streptomyces]MCX4648103.1 hypothetical protein [Streptomyces sp. NBC_01446]
MRTGEAASPSTPARPSPNWSLRADLWLRQDVTVADAVLDH